MRLLFPFCIVFCLAKSAIAQTNKSVSGQLVYNNNCLSCHQADGKGVIGMNPPLSKTQWVLGDKKQLITILLKGMKQQLVIGDEIYDNAMPAQSHLSDKEIAAVLSYVRSNFGNQATAITELEVKNVRQGK
jgi:mono/diheme cytochrome c family protein